MEPQMGFVNLGAGRIQYRRQSSLDWIWKCRDLRFGEQIFLNMLLKIGRFFQIILMIVSAEFSVRLIGLLNILALNHLIRKVDEILRKIESLFERLPEKVLFYSRT